LLTCAHTARKSTSAPLFFCTSGKETVENLQISCGQLAPCQESRIKRQQTVSSAGCKVLAPKAGCLLASMPSYCRFRPIECCYSQSVSVSVPQDKIRGSAIPFLDCTVTRACMPRPAAAPPARRSRDNPRRPPPAPAGHPPPFAAARTTIASSGARGGSGRPAPMA